MVMRTFNKVFWFVASLFLLILVIGTVMLRKTSMETRENVLVIVSLLTVAGFFLYKLFLSKDKEFDELRGPMGGFNWWNELPLQLCNINMVLLPIAVKLKIRALLSFCSFVGPLGAVMAIMMPGIDFNNASIFLPRMLGFYGTHYMVVIEGWALLTLNIYEPMFTDIPSALAVLFITAGLVHLFNMTLRKSGLYARANYFYTIETEGNMVFDWLHDRIPVPFWYEVPLLLVGAAYMAVVIFLYNYLVK